MQVQWDEMDGTADPQLLQFLDKVSSIDAQQTGSETQQKEVPRVFTLTTSVRWNFKRLNLRKTITIMTRNLAPPLVKVIRSNQLCRSDCAEDVRKVEFVAGIEDFVTPRSLA